MDLKNVTRKKLRTIIAKTFIAKAALDEEEGAIVVSCADEHKQSNKGKAGG